MFRLINNIEEFNNQISKNKIISLDFDGEWYIENFLINLIYNITGLQDLSKKDILKKLNLFFNRLEEIPVRFSYEAGACQLVDFHAYLTSARCLMNTLQSCDHPDACREIHRLERRVIALLYRLEEVNGGLCKSGYDFDLLNSLQEQASKWKQGQKIFWSRDLSVADVRQLEQTCRYPEFVVWLLKDEGQLHDFFLWSLRDGMDVAPYIEFPAHEELVSACNLRGRLGRLGGDMLKIQKLGIESQRVQEKILTLPFEGKDISILNKRAMVTLRGEFKLSLEEVFQIFQDKTFTVGDLELFADGITNWNATYLAWRNAARDRYEQIELDKEEWWSSLPILETLSLQEAQVRYGPHLDGRKWNLAAKAAREYLSLHFIKTHAYLEVAIPDREGKNYAIYDFGKMAADLPANFWQSMRMLCETVPGVITYPDENIFLSNRQHVGYSFELTPEEGKRYMDSIKEDILTARQGNSVFQIETENCGKWIQVRLEEQLGKKRVPNLYRVSLLKAHPAGWWKRLFQFISALPFFLQEKALVWVHLPLAPWKGRWILDKNGKKVWKSVTTSSFWQDTIVYLPAYLHHQHENGVFDQEPNRHKVTLRGCFDMRIKRSRKFPDPFPTLDLFKDQINNK